MSDETNVSLIKFGTAKAEDVAKHIAETKSTIDNINKLLAHTVTAVQQLQAVSQEQNKNNEAVNNAFKSLQDGVKDITSGIRGVKQTIDDSNDSGDKRGSEEQVRQKNAEKTQRAVQNALFGEVKKNRTAFNVLQDTLKNCFNKTLDILKDGFKKSLQAYDELSSSLRKQNLSTELKNQAHLLSDLANKGNFAVSKQSVNAVTEYLAANDTALFKKFTDVNATAEQKKLYGEIVNVGALLKESGISEDKITTLMANANASNIEGFRKIAVQAKASGSEGEAARLAIDKLLSTPGGLASLGTNGFDKLNTSLLAVRELASTGAANAELSSGLVELATKIENGKLYDVDEQTLMKALAISGNNINNPKELTDSINKKLLDINAAANSGNVALATKMAEDLKRSIEPLSQELPDFVIGMQNAANRAVSGNINTGGAENFEEIEQNIKTNRQDGLIGDVIGDITSSINLFTAKLGFDGGALGSLSTFLDETTNGQLTVEEVVSSGFNAVTDLLKTINLQLVAQSIGNFFMNTPLAGKLAGSILPKLAPILGKALSLVPGIGAALIAIGSLGFAVKQIYDVIKKDDNENKANRSFLENEEQIKETKNALNLAVKSNSTADIKRLKDKLGELEKARPELEQKLKQAQYDNMNGTQQAAEDFAVKFRKENAERIKKLNLYKRTGKGDSKEARELEAKINDEQAFLKFYREQANSFLSYFFTFTEDEMRDIFEFVKRLRQQIENIKKSLSETFDKVKSVIKSIPDKFNNFIKNTQTKFLNFIDNIKSKFNEIIDPIAGIFANISQSISSDIEHIKTLAGSIFKPITDVVSEILTFNWLPEWAKKVVNAVTSGEYNEGPVKMATGGIVNEQTNAIIGEAGKEAVLPLTKPGALSKVLLSLDNSDKLQLLKILLKQSSFSVLGLISALTSLFKGKLFSNIQGNTSAEQNNSLQIPDIAKSVPGNDQATIEKILSYAGADRNLVYDLIVNGRTKKYGFGLKKREEWFKEALANAANQDGRDLIRGTYAERALEYGVSEIGKPYILRSLGKIGYVCNELVNAAVKASGFDMNKFMVHGVKATFANIKKGKYSDKNKYPDFRLRPDLTPQTALPGMVFFQDSRKNKEGGFQPGHIGLVYYGHQKLHSSGGSSDYSKTGFLRNWQTPCRGVTVTPFDNNSYVIGEFPGLFEQVSGEWKPPVNSPVPFGPGMEGEANKYAQIKSVKDTGLMTNEEITDLLVKQTWFNASAAEQYVSQAMSLSEGESEGEVLAV